MGTFAASLRAMGDVQGLPATVELEDGVLSIAAGDTSIGQWSLKDIHMEPIPSGYRIAAEGDQILLEVKELDRFNDELAAKRSRFRRKTKGVKEKAADQEPEAPAPDLIEEAPASPVRLEPRAEADTKPKRQKRAEKAAETKREQPAVGFGAKVLHFIDTSLDKANDKLGPYLPEWVFTRLMFGVVVVALILALIFPGLVSALMLIAGAIVIVFGAVIYSDPMLASKWLPGRTTPTHVLLFGVAILMLGVLMGVIAG